MPKEHSLSAGGVRKKANLAKFPPRSVGPDDRGSSQGGCSYFFRAVDEGVVNREAEESRCMRDLHMV